MSVNVDYRPKDGEVQITDANDSCTVRLGRGEIEFRYGDRNGIAGACLLCWEPEMARAIGRAILDAADGVDP